jgi:hypothetical protein
VYTVREVRAQATSGRALPPRDISRQRYDGMTEHDVEERSLRMYGLMRNFGGR